MLRIFISVSLGGVFLVPSSWSAQPPESRPIKVRGQTFSLTVSPDEVIVRPSKTLKESREFSYRGRKRRIEVERFANLSTLATATMQAQARLTQTPFDPSRLGMEVIDPGKKKAPPKKEEPPVAPKQVVRFGKELGGVFVPRLPGVKTVQISALLRSGEDPQARVEPVFKFQDRRVVLLRSVTVRFAAPPPPATVEQVSRELQLKAQEQRALGGRVVKFDLDSQAPDAITVAELLSSRPDVRWVDPGLAYEIRPFSASAPSPPNDTFFPKQWYLGDQEPAGLNIGGVWDVLGNGTNTITVAVLDDGVDVDHADLAGRCLPGKDFFEGDEDPRPAIPSSHGTACAGVIAALSNNGVGVAGIAPRARILPVRISGETTFATDTAIAESILFAQEKGAKILNCSWGGGPPSNFIMDAIDAVSDDDRLVVAAAGNAIPSMTVFFPARYERCVAVGAVRRTGSIWNYSCWGPENEVDLVAPSGDVNLQGDIWTTDHTSSGGFNVGGMVDPETGDSTGDYTGRFGGTSAAAPVVAGVAALVWAECPTLSAKQIREVLETTAKKEPSAGGWVDGRSKVYGMGRIDPMAALNKAKQLVAANPNPIAPPSMEGGLHHAATWHPQPPPKGPPKKTPAEEVQNAINASKKPLTYSSRGEKIQLDPKPGVVGVLTPPDADVARAKLNSKLAKPEWATQWQSIGKSGQVNVCSTDMMSKAAARGELDSVWGSFKITPVYTSGKDDSLQVPTGNITVKPKDEAAKAKLIELAAKNGLEIGARNEKLNTVTFRPKPKTTDLNPTDALKAFTESGLVDWAEPELARQLKR
jgi:subtilisin family serine protease